MFKENGKNQNMQRFRIMDDEELELELESYDKTLDYVNEVLGENEDESDVWDDYDQCYECGGYGDDYYYDEEKDELVSNCSTCPYFTE